MSDNINISNDVIAKIASIAATEVKGVTGLYSGNLVNGIVKTLSKNSTKGVSVETSDDKTTIDIAIVAEYGVKLNPVAEKVQENVRTEVETMTGISNIVVNVQVAGLYFEENK